MATSIINNYMTEVTELALTDVFTPATGITFTNASYARMRNGRVGLHLVGTGSISSGSDGAVTIGTVNSAYRPFMNQIGSIQVNVATSGQVYGMAGYIAVGKDYSGNIRLIIGEANKTIGNASYPWTTTGGTDVSF